MKKLLFLILISITTLFSFGQENFKWNKIDTISLTKDELYSLTKSFIAEKFVSDYCVFIEDNQSIIKINCKNIQNIYHYDKYNYVYFYNMTFEFTDGRYILTIDSVYCIDAFIPNKKYVVKIQPFESISNDYGDFSIKEKHISYIPELKVISMMDNLKTEINNLFNSYNVYLSKGRNILIGDTIKIDTSIEYRIEIIEKNIKSASFELKKYTYYRNNSNISLIIGSGLGIISSFFFYNNYLKSNDDFIIFGSIFGVISSGCLITSGIYGYKAMKQLSKVGVQLGLGVYGASIRCNF